MGQPCLFCTKAPNALGQPRERVTFSQCTETMLICWSPRVFMAGILECFSHITHYCATFSFLRWISFSKVLEGELKPQILGPNEHAQLCFVLFSHIESSLQGTHVAFKNCSASILPLKYHPGFPLGNYSFPILSHAV